MRLSSISKPTSLRDAGFFCARKNVAAEKGGLFHLADPAQPGFPGRGGVVEFVTVEAHAGLEPQRVARAEATGNHLVIDRAAVLPQLFGMIGSEINLEAILAGVAGACNEAIHAADFAKSEMIVADGLERNGGEALQDLLGARAFGSPVANSAAGVFDFGVKLVVGDDVVEISVLIAGIDAQQIVRVRNFMDEQIVNEAPDVIRPE